MREFVVTLRCGVRFVVKASRVVLVDRQFLALVADRADANGDDATADTVALFDRSQVAAVVAKENLVSEERCDPIGERFANAGADDPIPF